MLGAMSDWVYNRNPTESLHFEGPLKELKEDLASGKKVSQLANPHPCTANTHDCAPHALEQHSVLGTLCSTQRTHKVWH